MICSIIFFGRFLKIPSFSESKIPYFYLYFFVLQLHICNILCVFYYFILLMISPTLSLPYFFLCSRYLVIINFGKCWKYVLNLLKNQLKNVLHI
jgi:hypothetical protein